MEVRIRIRMLREERGLLSKEFWSKVGISPQMGSHYETGRNSIPIELLPAIATELGVTIDDLFGLSLIQKIVEFAVAAEVKKYMAK